MAVKSSNALFHFTVFICKESIFGFEIYHDAHLPFIIIDAFLLATGGAKKIYEGPVKVVGSL